MKKDKSIIILFVVAGLILGYYILFGIKVKLELRSEYLYVNIHDTVDLRKAVDIAKGNNKNLVNRIKYSGDIGDSDNLKNGNLYVGDFSQKTITYTLKYGLKTVKRTLIVIVISDPNDPAFKPNYDYVSTETNEDDAPNNQVDNNLTDKQKEYINSLVK